MKIFVLGLSALFSLPAFAANIGDFVRDKNGQIVHMPYYKAFNYCASKHSRLPTIRELAEFAEDHGSAGIRETRYPDSTITQTNYNLPLGKEMEDMSAKGYGFVAKLNKQGFVVVDFYFNGEGFDRDPDGLDDNVWSSSFRPAGDGRDSKMAYVFFRGDIYYTLADLHDNPNAVRCIE